MSLRRNLLLFLTLLPLLLSAACQPSGVLEDAPPILQASEFPPSSTPFQPLPTTALPHTPTSLPPTLSPTHTPTATLPPSPTPPAYTTLLFSGVIVPARCVQAAIDVRDDADYIYENVRELIQAADLAVGTLNATLSDYPPRTGCVFTYVLVGAARNADALQRAGFDVMSVATNHIKNCGIGDCGDRAFFDTLDNLRRVGILPVGAGNNLAEGMQPVVVTLNGIRFGIVSLGMVEPLAFASETTPGIAELTEANLRAAIAAARRVADVVIAMPHWGPEDTPNPNSYQLEFARIAVEAGADLVVGNHTHVVQAVQQINGIPVFYGLGNFVFDQDWDLAHQQGVLLRVTFEGTRLAGYEFIPTHVDGDGTVHLADEAEAAQILERIQQASDLLK